MGIYTSITINGFFQLLKYACMYALSCRTAAPGKLGLTDRGATVPSIQKTVCLLCTKSCAWF